MDLSECRVIDLESDKPFVVLPLPVQGVVLAAHAYVRVIRGSGAPGVEASILVGDAQVATFVSWVLSTCHPP
jgi:hypothetical protein